MMEKIKLDNIGKSIPYKVKDGYFDELSESIMVKTSASTSYETVWFFRKAAFVSYAFAIVAVFIGLWVTNPLSKSTKDLFAEFTDDELIDYLALTDISEAEITDFILDEEINSITADDLFFNEF